MSATESPERLERRTIISGIGQSQVGRRLGRSELELTIEGCLEAVRDAGLELSDIDGLSTYPGMGLGGGGFAGPGTPEVQDALRLKLNWHDGGGEGAGQIRAVFAACLAVAAGLARHVLVYRTVTESTAQGSGGRQGIGGAGASTKIGGFMQWSLPFGAVSAANWLALVAQRRARMISTPLCLFDCDAPCDGSTVVVVSHRDYARDAPHPVAHINAIGTALRGRPSWDQFDDMTQMAARDAGASLWERTDLTPGDVEIAELYDGFSILTMVWLEALGFCGRGESGAFVEGGTRIALEGALPLNTAGGQLSGGRLHGFGLLHEACLQMRGDAGDRQVIRNHGGPPRVAAVANGGGPIAGAMLLTKEPG
jgi:acetyl-CoA acetyltransferase